MISFLLTVVWLIFASILVVGTAMLIGGFLGIVCAIAVKAFLWALTFAKASLT